MSSLLLLLLLLFLHVDAAGFPSRDLYRWYTLAENGWYIFAEKHWHTVAEKGWHTIAENRWYTCGRKLTPADKTLYQRQSEATDRQIDALVYELYELTEEEIAIVESGGGKELPAFGMVS